MTFYLILENKREHYNGSQNQMTTMLNTLQ